MAGLAAVVVLTAATVAADSAADKAEVDIRVDAPSSIEQGKKGEISLTLTPKAGRRLSEDGPIRIAVAIAPDKGLTLSKRLFHRRDAVDAKAAALRFKLEAAAVAAGRYEIDLDMRFWVCGARTCRPVRVRRQVVVEVTAPAAEPTPGPAP